MVPHHYYFGRALSTLASLFVVLLMGIWAQAGAQSPSSSEAQPGGREAARIHQIEEQSSEALSLPNGHPTVASNAQGGQPFSDLDSLCPEKLSQALYASGIESIAVQSEGMNYSLRTWSEVLVAGVTGKVRYQKRDPVIVALSMAYRQSEWLAQPVIPIESPLVAQLLGLDPNVRHRVSVESLMEHPVGQRYIMAYLTAGDSALQGLEPKTQKAVKKVAFRVAMLMNVRHDFRIVPLGLLNGAMASPFIIEQPAEDPEAAKEISRARVSDELVAAAVRLHGDLREAIQSGQANPSTLRQSVAEFLAQAQLVEGYPPAWKRKLDRWYTTFHPFGQAARVYWVAALSFLIVLYAVRRRLSQGGTSDAPLSEASSSHEPVSAPMQGVRVLAGPSLGVSQALALRELPLWARAFYALGLTSLFLAALALTSGLVARYFLGGRIPVSNMYESITFTMGSFAIIGVVFESLYRRAWMGFVVALAGTFCMTMANSMPLHQRKIDPLVAVLNSVWLNYHVTSLLVSYAAFLLSFLFALAYFAKDVGGSRLNFLPSQDTLEKLCYRAVLVGWPLLTIGIFLGAVWANTAWGRYWSWDPKETWAFITWLTYTIYLHLRMVRGWRGRWSVAASMIGFVMVLITYFGVSYLPGLAGGLHSYAEPIAR